MRRHGELIAIAIAAVFALTLAGRGFAVYGYNQSKTVIQPAPTATAESPNPALPPPSGSPVEQAVLKAQLETMKQYDQQLLATVYWGLGGAFLLLVLVGGVNWFTNIRQYERERDSLRESLSAGLESARAIAKEEADRLALMMKGFQGELARMSAEASKMISDAGDAAIRAGRKAAEDRVREVAGPALAAQQEKIARLRRDFTFFLRQHYMERGIWYQAFEAALEELQAMRDADTWYDFWLSDLLRDMEAILSHKPTVNYSSLELLKALFSKVPEVMAGQAGKVREMAEHCRHN